VKFEIEMTSSRPYLIRAIYDWLLDNRLTPYVMVDVHYPDVSVPQQFVKDGKIILNISPSAVSQLSMGNRVVEFSARFSGIPHNIYVPVMAVQAIYSYENGRGMVFNEDDEDTGEGDPPDDEPPPKGKGRPHLRVIK
jgi:stringent starvation protein B